jgi:glycosyltransferase involved in cell wall biosynthesis
MTGPNSPETAQARDVEQKVFNIAQRVVVTTYEMQKDILQRIPASASRVAVIPNYVEIDRFSPRYDLREKNTTLFVGRIAPEKNLASLIEAVRSLNIQLAIIKKGPLENELRESFGILEVRLQWLGNVSNSDLPYLFNKASMFVLPAFYEGHPKALIEAMVCGLPVIGADSAGIRDLIRHRETSYLYGTDAGSIQKAIKELLADLPYAAASA